MALVSASAVSFKLASEPTMVTAADIIVPISTSAISFKLASEPTMVITSEIVIPISTSVVSFAPVTVASGGGSSGPIHVWNTSF